MQWQGKPPIIREHWNRWYAWFPIKTLDHQWIWLEAVERRYFNDGYSGSGWLYRIFNKE
jgi:hypothetical protein